MDPLSISVSVLTLIGAAVEIAKGFESLKATRKLPQDFASLLAEVADLQHELEQCKAQISHNGNQHVAARLYGSRFVDLTRAAKDKLEHLALKLPANTCQNGIAPVQKLKVYWTGVVDGKSRLRRSRDELRDIRLGLVQALASLTAPLVCGIDAKVADIFDFQKTSLSLQKETRAAQQDLLTTLITLSERAKAAGLQQPPTYHASITETATLSVNLTSTSPVMTRNKSSVRARRNGMAVSSASDLQLPPDRFAKYCMPWCSCDCHTPSSMSSYDALRDIFGCLSINHSGIPGLVKPCSEKKHCRRRMSPKLSVRYRLPRAIANFQFLMCSFSTLAGVELRVKLPRVVDWTSPVWQFATMGNFEAVANLFRNGLASPWDVSPVGGNLLHYATDHWNPELCRLLLDADLDPEAEDDFKSTGVCIAWERVLSGQMSSNDATTVATLFRNTDYLSSRSFTVIHKIVLGLISKNLDFELECSTADIDKQDSRGRTALSWAVARGDETSTRILLEHKADPNIADIQGHRPLHYVQNTTCAELLLEHNADLHALNGEKQTALYTACRSRQSASLVQFLITAGSDPNALDMGHQAPLHNIRDVPFTAILLDAGADVNVRNKSGDTPVRFTIVYNLHKSLRRMLQNEDIHPDFSGVNEYGQSFAHSVARTADAETVGILSVARPASLMGIDLSLRDRAGKTAEEYFNERLEFLESDEEGALRNAFRGLVGVFGGGEPEDARAVEVAKSQQLGVTVRLSECSLDEDEEVFHDAVESF